jgi:predicted ArsR family transcriptional regulator
MPSIADEENINRKNIEKALVRYKEGATINQIARELNFSWITVKKHLDYLQTIGRVEIKNFAGKEIYFLNGKGEWQTKITLSPSHSLFFDTFTSLFGGPYVRIKETKLVDGKWKTMGNVMITSDKLGEAVDFLTKLRQDIKSY